MSNGRYISHRFPYVPVHIEVHNREADEEALLDTGFDGDLAVPPGLVTNGQPDGHLRWTLADGSTILAPYYMGTISVQDMGPFPCVVTALGDEPLVGCGVAAHFTITLDHGQTLSVER
jgi:predicted aspartyl protease